MRGTGRSAKRTTTKLLRVLSGVPAAFLICLALRAPVRASEFVSIDLNLTVTYITTGTTTPPIPLALEAPTEVASLDYLTIPVTLDAQGETITSATLFYQSVTGTSPGTPAPRLLAAPGPITSANVGDWSSSTGTFSPAIPAAKHYYTGYVIIPASAYRNGGINYVLRVVTSGGTKYVGLSSGGVMVDVDQNDPAGLIPFQTPYNSRPQTQVSSAGGVAVLSDGGPVEGATRVIFPQGAVSGNSDVFIEQLDPADTARVPRPAGTSAPVAAFEFEASVRQFNKPIELSLRYPDVDGDGIVDGTTVNAGTLRVFWWDGYVWRYVGGQVDAVHHVVTAKTTHFSIYALFPSVSAAPPAAAAYRPLEKIITPNGDGINDSAKFSGLLNGKDFEIRIFDVTGRRIRAIQTTDEWDGKDDNGKRVENGAYIYQYRADSSSEWVSGMIGVAK